MPKHLRQIVEKVSEGKDTNLKGVKSSKTTKLDVSDLNDSPGNQKFAAGHSREDHADRVGNGDEDYKGKTKQASEMRHGNTTKEKSKKAYSKMNETSCGDDMQPKDKPKKGQKVLLGGKKPIEEREMSSSEKEKETKLKAKYDPSDMKEKMKDQYGEEKGKQVYFAYIRKKAMSKKKE